MTNIYKIIRYVSDLTKKTLIESAIFIMALRWAVSQWSLNLYRHASIKSHCLAFFGHLA